MKKSLSKSYPSRHGVPVLTRVDTAIFVRSYFMKCMECSFCNDACCTYGVDVDAENAARLMAHADDLERFTGVSRDEFFTGEWSRDAEFPGGQSTRTRTNERGCVFLARTGRGCMLHAYALERGVDYHELKPMVSSLFPLTFDGGLLHPSEEVSDRSLVCLGEGATLYRGVRDELLYYFGEELVAELDALESA